MIRVIKITLACLFFICLFEMPYGFYQFVRFTALLGFGILAYKGYESHKQKEVIIYIALAILFQPILKISLGRELWNVVDVIVGLALLGSLFIKSKNAKED